MKYGQMLIDCAAIALLVVGVPVILWYFTTQDISPLVDFFRTK